MGRGYVPADRKAAQHADGMIPIDALLSPIKKVNYVVTNARVGQQTDYDRLTLEPDRRFGAAEDAVAYAAKILKDQSPPDLFINFEETYELWRAGIREQEKLNENLDKSVDELELSGSLGQLPPECEHPVHW